MHHTICSRSIQSQTVHQIRSDGSISGVFVIFFVNDDHHITATPICYPHFTEMPQHSAADKVTSEKTAVSKATPQQAPKNT
jgi:hypothetical protein